MLHCRRRVFMAATPGACKVIGYGWKSSRKQERRSSHFYDKRPASNGSCNLNTQTLFRRSTTAQSTTPTSAVAGMRCSQLSWPVLILRPDPGKGSDLPDHGEVWMLPWQDAGTGDGVIRLSVEGRALPYRLSRSLAFSSHRTVRLSYLLKTWETNPWAICGHPILSFCLIPDSP